jgi:predicted RND superfamily exporter protein
LPLAVILVVPMCILGSLTGVYVTHGDINIFTQIGFVVLVGLASKNAILIVEFAKRKLMAGLSRWEATLEACRLRLRPILMTSFAFILGTVPLLVSTGAGFEMRRTLGIAVFSGMLGVTIFGIFLTPVFFNVIEWLAETSPFNWIRSPRWRWLFWWKRPGPERESQLDRETAMQTHLESEGLKETMADGKREQKKEEEIEEQPSLSPSQR